MASDSVPHQATTELQVLESLQRRGADVNRLRAMAREEATSLELKEELRRLGLLKLSERAAALKALRAAAQSKSIVGGDRGSGGAHHGAHRQRASAGVGRRGGQAADADDLMSEFIRDGGGASGPSGASGTSGASTSGGGASGGGGGASTSSTSPVTALAQHGASTSSTSPVTALAQHGASTSSTSPVTALAQHGDCRHPTASELAVVDAPRVRAMGLFEGHNERYLERFGARAALGANDDERPWEAIALGREVQEQCKTPYVRPRLYRHLSAGEPGADEAAEKANEQALERYKAKDWGSCYEAAGEAIRLNPRRVAYYGNRAAAALKLRGLEHLRQAARDCVEACALEPSYVKGYVRSAEAHFLMGEPHTVRIAIEMYEAAFRLEPQNASIEAALERIKMIFASDYA